MSDFDLNELMATFADETAEHIAALEAGLLALETSPGDAETKRELLRLAHTIKGNASCVGLTEVTAFAHAYEEILERVDDVALLLSGLDLLKAGIKSANGKSDPKARVGAEKLNRMLDLAGEIAIARGRVQQLLAGASDSLIEAERQIDVLQSELQELIMRMRMVPIGPLFRQYARVIRDIAPSHGKEARLVTIGDDVEIDTNAVEMLRDPLTHMIRNAIDHGIESPERRAAAGKPAAGTITLQAKHEAGTIIIRVSDDGAGIDRRAIEARAKALGIAPLTLPAPRQRGEGTERVEPSPRDAGRGWREAPGEGPALDRLIFESGFTTSDTVTDLSGRGVGMDVVRRAIEALRGTISIATREGEGTTFSIRLPLTLAVIEGFGITAAGESYVVPMEHVLECIELPPGTRRGADSGVLLLRDEIIPYVRLRSLFALEGPESARENVLVVEHSGAKAGLVVDELHGAGQAVIKPLGDYFSEVPGVAGSSILGNGRVALILDTQAILRGVAESVEA
jgi:two-component system chemotaxis sensor kinase CheA